MNFIKNYSILAADDEVSNSTGNDEERNIQEGNEDEGEDDEEEDLKDLHPEQTKMKGKHHRKTNRNRRKGRKR